MDGFRMDDHVAIVTGASRGIGRAIALAFAEAGADVVIGARDADALASTADDIKALGQQSVAVAGSLTERDGLAALVDEAVASFGRVTTVVNNVGGSAPSAFLDTSEQKFETALHWNVTTAFNLTQLAVPPMLDTLRGTNLSVINIASSAGRFASRGFAAYGTAKAAMIHLTKAVAQDLAPRIRVNAIAPGAIETDALRSVLTPALTEAMIDGTPLKRLGREADIAAAAVYLGSPASSYVTGQVLPVDGGIQGSNLELGLPDL